MIVELLDYRPIRNRDPILEKPEKTRVVLQHNDETLWADLSLLQQRSNFQLSDTHVLEIESRVLVCPHVSCMNIVD
jgi:transcription factor SPT20